MSHVKLLRWPVVVVISLLSGMLIFRGPIGERIHLIQTVHVEHRKEGTTAELRFARLQAAASLGAAEAKQPTPDPNKSVDNPPTIANVVEQSTQPATLKAFANATVLWVDDHPDNNFNERKALEALGMHIEASPSTADALEQINSNSLSR